MQVGIASGQGEHVRLLTLVHCLRVRPGQQVHPPRLLALPDANIALIADLDHQEATRLAATVALGWLALIADNEAVPAARRTTDLVELRDHDRVGDWFSQWHANGDKAAGL